MRHTCPGSTEGPNQNESKRPIPRHIKIKMWSFKDKERILKVVRDITHKGALIKLAADFSTETLQARRD